MNKPTNGPLANDPAYLFAQILLLRDLVARIADATMSGDEFMLSALDIAETRRLRVEPKAVPENFLRGIDDFEAWVRSRV